MRPSLTSRFRRSLATAAALAGLASCATNGPRTQTQYLEAFSPQAVPGSANYATDTVSYWDGEGLSGPSSIVIDLSDQRAFFYKGGTLAGVSSLSTGDEGHPTTTGKFKIFEKDKDHRSNLYGDFVDANGEVVVQNVDITKDKPPPGTRFLGSEMTWFMRFNGGAGMHKGYLPGYAASHGCVRMPAHMAEIFFNHVSIGTPVTVQH
ncbi:MAG: L,D-transpeptidase family protein [Verrucomicrobiaceae bacterium]|nr:L,D-transpeptidase family protein [Verrucomicrobiaceae bacterium]